MSGKKKKKDVGALAKNRKAYHDYEILSDVEAGLALTGSEVKSIKAGLVNLKGAFVDGTGEELFVNEMHVSKYEFYNGPELSPTRKRKLLLHKGEIIKLLKDSQEQGITLIPLKLYATRGLIKMKVGVCRGKQLHDKRETLKRKAQTMEIKRQMKRFV